MRRVAAFVQKTTLGTNSNHRAHGVEEVRKHQREDQQNNRNNAKLPESSEEVDLEKRVKAWNRNRRAAQSRNGLSPTGRRALTAHGKVDEKLEDRGQNRRGDKADEHSALNLAHVQDDGQTKANNEDQGRPSLQGAVNTELNRGCACTNNARVDQANQGNKKTDTYRDSGLDLVRDCAKNCVSEPC